MQFVDDVIISFYGSLESSQDLILSSAYIFLTLSSVIDKSKYGDEAANVFTIWSSTDAHLPMY